MTLDKLVDIENCYILKAVEDFLKSDNVLATQQIDDLIKEDISLRVHANIIRNLVYNFLKPNSNQKELCASLILGWEDLELVEIECFEMSELAHLCEDLHILFLNSGFKYENGQIQRKKSKDNLVERGAVYTNSIIAREIVDNTIKNISSHLPNDFHILDFACGTCRFYQEIIGVLTEKYNISVKLAVIEHIHAVDIDEVAVNITRLKALSFLDHYTIEDINKISQNIICRNLLVKDSIFHHDLNGLQSEDLLGLPRAGYDAIVSNPPYLVLKANKNKFNTKQGSRISKLISYFRNSDCYHYSIEGMLNLYQISIECMISMLKPNGILGIICPSTIFADISCFKLRRYLILYNKILAIKYFGEKSQLFENITQATNIFYVQKQLQTDCIKISKSDEEFSIPVKLVKSIFPTNLEIPQIGQIEWDILVKLSEHRALSSFKSIRNKRGELDLTICKTFITKEVTKYRLVRGNMIKGSAIIDVNGEFVSEDFIGAKSADYIKFDFGRRRLICQQISNMETSKRLSFVFCDANDILANSCNYISASDEILQKLNLILNSRILNWRFKITSSNNHINNYEIDTLPIVDLSMVDSSFKYQSQEELDYWVGSLYGLTDNQIKYIINK